MAPDFQLKFQVSIKLWPGFGAQRERRRAQPRSLRAGGISDALAVLAD